MFVFFPFLYSWHIFYKNQLDGLFQIVSKTFSGWRFETNVQQGAISETRLHGTGKTIPTYAVFNK